MAVGTPQRTSHEKWQDGINAAVSNEKWNAWDCVIIDAVNEYNRHLANTADYRPLDWRYIKAMLWVESGAGSASWKTKPLQIGVPGDPGLNSLLSAKEGGNKIIPAIWKSQLTRSSVINSPVNNIRAGIGYLLMRLAYFEYQSVTDTNAAISHVTVKTGDSLERIANSNGTTVNELKQMNPDVATLKPGQTVKFRKAKITQVITGWRNLTTSMIAQRYNGGGDPGYSKKLDYALNLIRKGKTPSCTSR